MRPTQLGILFSLLLLTATTLKAESEEDRVALTAYLNRALSAEDGFEDRYAAEVWLVDMQQRLARFLADPAERLDLLTRVHQQASELNLPPGLVLSVIEVESAFDRYAVSRVGAQGLVVLVAALAGAGFVETYDPETDSTLFKPLEGDA